MTAPKICEKCGVCLDAGEECDCEREQEDRKISPADIQEDAQDL